MGITELVLIALGLAMDAFSVSVCKGLSMKKIDCKGAFVTALFFGIFQSGMPLIGYFLGSRFESFISTYSHWIAFILLGFIGGKMIYEVIRGEDDGEKTAEYRLDIKELVVLAVATSIDALAVGVIFTAHKERLLFSVGIIGAITFLVCLIGVAVGNRFGSKYEKKAELVGGIVLVLIGVKLLLGGLGVL
ncbi:MAG: manganese efflux pump MntP family protein [Ruminococcus flavefaciens]|nr:manganese efflux pump MntP family protein [Ruminococcus flavefaciens]MCM1230453.1 manganese efflux pump MntP family protein [Ruminococcus flavefaciens]